MTCEEKFIEIYGREPETSFCPYRIAPLGAHIDHQFGQVHGLALNYGVHMAYGIKRNGIVELQSLNFPKRVQFHINAVPDEKVGEWGDYLRGATLELRKKYKLKYGIAGVIRGALPSGGISSSAALTICYLRALCAANEIELEDTDFIYMAKRAENEYVGVSTGKLDQSCETLCRKGQLLALDCLDDSFANVAPGTGMPDYKIGIFFSGVPRSLANSAYNNRVDECRAAAFALYSYAPGLFEPGLKFKEMVLRRIPEEVFKEYGGRLPDSWQKRARHFYTEMDRVRHGLTCWKNGDLAGYGKLINESGRSSIVNYECGSPELIKLYDILSKQDGVYGSRFSGAGFNGCTMALIDPKYEDRIKAVVEREYLADFPEMAGKYKAYICETADGVGKANDMELNPAEN